MKSFEDFLDRQLEGRLDSTGSFQLAPQQMIAKLGGVLLQPQAWILKFVQAASVLRASELDLRLGRRTLSLEMKLPARFPLDDPERFFQPAATASPAHQHLLLGLLCALNLHTSEKGFLSWSGAPGRLICVANHGGKFSFGAVDDPAAADAPRLQFVLHRRSVTTVEKLFRKACFSAECRLLEERVRLCPVLLRLDGRTLRDKESGAFQGWVVHRGIKPCGDGERALALPVELTEGSASSTRGSAYLEVEFHQGTRRAPRKAPCRVAWVADGVAIEMEELLGEYEQVAYTLYLDASDLATDLSTLNISDEQAKAARVHNAPMQLWQLSEMERACRQCEQAYQQSLRTSTQAERASRELANLLPNTERAPPDLREAAEGLRLRIQQFWATYR